MFQRGLVCLALCLGLPSIVPADEKLPSDAQRLVDRFEDEADLIQKEAELKILLKRRETLAALRELQDKYTKQGMLDEALAIRERIRNLQDGSGTAAVNILPDPGRLYQYQGVVNQPLYFQVVGRIEGTIWGSEIYTGDSSLATAAVHAGAVKLGEVRVVKVTMLPGQATYAGTTQNGVTSSPYAGYSYSFKVEPTRYKPVPNLASEAYPYSTVPSWIGISPRPY